MAITWAHVGPTMLAAFLASLVEFVEALTIVLAVGTIRGWRSALVGIIAASGVLLVLVLLLGPALMLVPIGIAQLGVGCLLLLFGLRWLRKAVLRAAAIIPMHDETAAFAEETARLRKAGRIAPGLDPLAVGTAFNIVMLEGIEVVFVVIAIGAGAPGLLVPAGLGALAALIIVIGLGLVAHRPLARVPENALKFGVGVLLAAFGTFWIGEGIGIVWPGADWALLGLAAGYGAAALVGVLVCRTSGARVFSTTLSGRR